MKKSENKVEPFWKDAPLVEEKEILFTLSGDKGSSLFLGRYSLNEVIMVMRRRGFFKEAAKRKLSPLVFDLDSSGHPLQRLRIFVNSKTDENMIVDLKVREAAYPLKTRLEGLSAVISPKSLILEWLTLQNPLLKFTEGKTPLPGQAYPGLNLSNKIMDIFVYMARLTHKDCLLAFPAFFHNALLFSRYFHFMNPDKEGEIFAIRKSFSRMPFKQLAWIVHLDCLKRGDGSIYEWEAEEQIFPLNKTLQDIFSSRGYKDRVRDAMKAVDFTVDWESFRVKAAGIPALCGSKENLL